MDERAERLVLGVGLASPAEAMPLLDLVYVVLREAGMLPARLTGIATIASRQGHPALQALAEALDLEVVSFPASALASVVVPSPSAKVASLAATPSVAEAAALLAAGAGSRLLVPKRRGCHVTCALAARAGMAP